MNKKQEFISDCISNCIKNGKSQEQASAICYSKWESRKSIVKGLISNLKKWYVARSLDSDSGGALIPQSLAGNEKKGKCKKK